MIKLKDILNELNYQKYTDMLTDLQRSKVYKEPVEFHNGQVKKDTIPDESDFNKYKIELQKLGYDRRDILQFIKTYRKEASSLK